jgi:hypothetical protein
MEGGVDGFSLACIEQHYMEKVIASEVVKEVSTSD